MRNHSLRSSRFGWLLVLTLGLSAVAAQAQEFRYRYVSLDEVVLPAPFTAFMAASLQDSGRVYGTVCDHLDPVTFECIDPHVAYFKDGTVTVVQSGFAGPVNAGGTVGSAVLVDPVNSIFQAALLRRGKVELIPPQPGEISSFVISLNDPSTALVESDTARTFGYVLYRNGRAAPLDFGPTVARAFFLSNRPINNQGLIAGIAVPIGGNLFSGARGFRFDPRSGQSQILSTFPGDPTETLAWGMGINTRGDVLGYSYTIGVRPYHERIGVWDRRGNFKTYLVRSTSSSRLLFNDNNLIVITLDNSTHTSNLVPRPGVSLDLADLVVNSPPGLTLDLVTDLNNQGDMIGISFSHGSFFLQRGGPTAPRSLVASTSSSRAKNQRRNMPPVAPAILGRRMPALDQLK